MFHRHSFCRFYTLLLVLALLSHSVLPVAHAQSTTPLYLPIVANGNAVPQTDLVFRTRITVQTPAQWRDLQRMEVVILEQEANAATVLVDDLQLEDLARLRYNPDATNALATMAAHDSTLQAAVADLLQHAEAISKVIQAAKVQGADTTINTARAELRAYLQQLETTQLEAITQAASVDTDNDGLTDDSEFFWCTVPTRADTDYDLTNDGAEVASLRDWMNNKLSGPPSTNKPFLRWPRQLTDCYDDDYDSIPDLAELHELGLKTTQGQSPPGLRTPWESTDNDKFDDGQELFGVTDCPGGDASCGYGDLPRSSDTGYVGSTMPGWVKAPGNHPLVAAYPVPEVDIIESSFKVETVTTITADHTIASGTQRSYSTSKTEGTSSSVANTTTWNEWQEVATTSPIATAQLVEASATTETQVWGVVLRLAKYIPTAVKAAVNYCFKKPVTGSQVLTCAQAGEQVVNAATGAYQTVKSWFGPEKPVGEDLQCKAPPPQLNQSTELSCRMIPDNGSGYGSEQNQITRQSRGGDESTPHNGNETLLKQTNNGQTATRIFELSNPVYQPVPTMTESQGKSWGGAQTTTNTAYEEHTITNGEAFSSEESWGNATAINSVHAADFWFSFTVRNTGTEYARQIKNLVFNLYLGSDPNPICTYNFATGRCGIPGDAVVAENLMPHSLPLPFTSARIPLSLEQMKAVDLGATIRVVIQNFSYGSDQEFYERAATGNLLIAIEDGTDDGDEHIESYLIPTWAANETVLQVLTRYFPYETDSNGEISAIWTPEYRTDNPAWCKNWRRPTDYPNKAIWCKHTLSIADWWNVYTDGLGDGSEGFQNTQAVPGSVALFRFNKDTDLDGFSDRSETQLGTDPKDASSFPHPEVLAGVHNIRSGNRVTSTLSLLNSGFYDAYGVEAVMVAPDDSVNITNNTVGGSGRVRALKQVIVGSSLKLQTPLPAAWTQANHATLGVGGYYTGAQDRTYTFTVTDCPNGGCTVGSGTWKLNWSDGRGATGQLAFGANYQSPNFQAVGVFGLTLALYSGNVANGESFTVAARTPRDTFQYTINRQPYTEPLVIVSYNDPQGNHRFVLPSAAMSLTQPTANLQQYAGTMLDDVGVEIVTSRPFTVGINSATLLVNNPSDKTLQNAHLFLEVINISGTVVAETPVTVTLPPGPTATQITFETSDFNPAYLPADDYIVMAFLTDYQGNILDTAGRPLSSFQVDPLPELAADDTTLSWNIGTVTQGTLLKHALALANTGFGRLYTYIPPTSGLALNTIGSRTVGAADQPLYELTLRTANLPVGPYDQTITLATSDPAQPTRSLRVYGAITAASGDTSGGVLQRPLDFAVTVPGSHSHGEWVDFTHDLGPEPQKLHPVRVYSQDYATMSGVGKYATNFGQGTASAEMFGDGRDGVMPASGNLDYDQGFGVGVVNSGSTGTSSINVSDSHGAWRINPGDAVLIHQTQGNSAGCWEINKSVSDIGRGTDNYQMAKPLRCNYSTSGNNRAQILRVPQYTACDATGTLTPLFPWNGIVGGIFAVMCANQINITGTIDANGQGFRSGSSQATNSHLGGQGGEGINGLSGHGGGGDQPWAATVPGGGGRTMDSDFPAAGSGPGTGGAGGGYTYGNQMDEGGGGGGGGGHIYGGGGGGGGADSNGPGGASGLANAETGGGGGGGTGGNSGGSGGNSGLAGATALHSGGAGGITGYTGGGGSGRGGSRDTGGGGGGGGGNYGVAQLSDIYFGSGGGGGGGHERHNQVGGSGGNGSGIVILFARNINVNGTIRANGINGQNANYAGAGGGGAGGSILLSTGSAVIGNSQVVALGGSGGSANAGGRGGNGSPGRIRIEYCEAFTGIANPPASNQKLNCYITEQVETAPYTNARLNLPETFSDGRTYNVQFGHKLDFNASSEQAAILRVPAGLVANSTLDVLINNASTGDLTLKLDIGNNGDWDWESTQNVTNAATFSSPDLSAAFNQYWSSHGSPTTGNVGIPVKLWLSTGATAFITNLQQLNLTATGTSAAFDPKPLDVNVVVTGSHTTGEWVQFTHNLGLEPQSLHPIKIYNQTYQTLWGVGKYAIGSIPTGTSLPWWNTDYRYRRPLSVQARDAIITPYTAKGSFNLRSLTGIRADLNDVRVVYWNGSSWIELDRSILADDLWLFPINTTITANQTNNNFWLYYGNPTANNPPTDLTKIYVPRYSSGVTSWYRFAECGGSPDDTGPDNNDLNTGANGTYVRGKFGCAYQGNGSNQYALKGAGDINKWHNVWVVEFWATKTKHGGDGGNQNIAVAKWGSWGNIDSFAVGTRDYDNSSRVWIKTDNSREYIWNVGLPATWNEPHHLAYVFRRDVGGFQFFWDGQLLIDAPSGIYQPTNTQAWTSLLTKGTGGWSGRDDHWGGTLEQVIISNVYRGSFPHAMIKQDPVVNVGAEQPVWITEQIETAPYNTARLNLPETFTDGRTYKVQFGRKLDFAAAGNQITTLRVPAGLYNSVQLDALVSGLPANATLSLDVGNNGSTEWSSTVVNNSTNVSADLAAAFTAYWRSQNSPSGGTLDVPIKVTTSQPGQILLTNLQVSATGSRLRYVRVPFANYTRFLLDFTAGNGGTVALDLGDNGSIDWSTSLAAPRQLTENLNDELNAYLAGKSGNVDVPVRFYLAPLHPITLNDYQATVASTLDLIANSITVGNGAVTAAGADSILIDADSTATVQATLRNNSSSASGPVTAAFFATATGWGDWYIGSAFVANIAATSNVTVTIPWNTTGFSGTVPVKVVINPYQRVAETNYNNNRKETSVVIPPPLVLPTAPTGLVATMAATNRITLTWTDASSNESGFKIERSLTGVNGWTQIATAGANVTTYASIGLACGKAYFYRVRSTNSNGDSAFSNVATTLTRLCTPAIQPVTGITLTQLTLLWIDNNSNESGFKIERSATGTTPWSQIATVGANVTTYTNSGLQCGTPHYYRVRAYNGGNNSAYSAIVNATTTICTPAAPTLLAATAISATQINLSWNDASSNESGFKIERSPDGVNSWTLLTTLGANVTSYANSGLACATTYHYRVRATNAGGDSPASNVANATTPACLLDLIFADGFESGSFSAWSGRPVGSNLRVTATAALAGSSQGMAALMANNTGMYITDQRPNAEPRYRTRFYFDPNTITMTSGDAHFIFYGYQGTTTVVLRIEFRRLNSSYQLRFAALNDTPTTGAATWRTSSYVTISDAPHFLELDWQAATAAGANNGSLTFWIDGIQRTPLTGLDNDTRRIDIARLGPIGGLDTGTRGAYYFDAFESRRRSYIGPAVGSAVAAELMNPEEIAAGMGATVLNTVTLQTEAATTMTTTVAGLGVVLAFPASTTAEPITAHLLATDTQTQPDGYILLGEMIGVATSAPVTQPVTVAINYSGLSAMLAPTATLSLQRWDDGMQQWEPIPTQVNPETQSLTAAIKAPAIFALWQAEMEALPAESTDQNEAPAETAAPAEFSIYLPLVQE